METLSQHQALGQRGGRGRLGRRRRLVDFFVLFFYPTVSCHRNLIGKERSRWLHLIERFQFVDPFPVHCDVLDPKPTILGVELLDFLLHSVEKTGLKM
jgi:hypothetical protein